MYLFFDCYVYVWIIQHTSSEIFPTLAVNLSCICVCQKETYATCNFVIPVKIILANKCEVCSPIFTLNKKVLSQSPASMLAKRNKESVYSKFTGNYFFVDKLSWFSMKLIYSICHWLELDVASFKIHTKTLQTIQYIYIYMYFYVYIVILVMCISSP
jgi:hypothetical protein